MIHIMISYMYMYIKIYALNMLNRQLKVDATISFGYWGEHEYRFYSGNYTTILGEAEISWLCLSWIGRRNSLSNPAVSFQNPAKWLWIQINPTLHFSNCFAFTRWTCCIHTTKAIL